MASPVPLSSALESAAGTGAQDRGVRIVVLCGTGGRVGVAGAGWAAAAALLTTPSLRSWWSRSSSGETGAQLPQVIPQGESHLSSFLSCSLTLSQNEKEKKAVRSSD